MLISNSTLCCDYFSSTPSLYLARPCISRDLLVRLELNRLYAVVVSMRRKALITNALCRITFTQGGYHADEKYCLPEGVMFCLPDKQIPESPARAQKRVTTHRTDCIECYPNGRLSSGTVYVATAEKTCFYALTVDASASSFLRRYSYDSGAWHRW